MKRFPWPKLYFAVADKHNWTPVTVRDELTILDLLDLKMIGTPRSTIPRGQAGAETVREAINRKRAAKGLAPI